MRAKRLFSFLTLSLLSLTAGCAQLTVAEREQMFGSHPPRIVKADAQSKMLYPNSWSIFLHVEDPDGDLTGFAGWVRLLGGLDEFYTVPLNPPGGQGLCLGAPFPRGRSRV